ncbi:MAG: DNA repair protein RecN, partial [Chloroflexi bacterium]|nr:DNA repair protein RecN [Chloroflexota bacterium]
MLSIANIAIIERQTVDFGPGLTVITGETGAGKSILIDALGLALGAKADLNLLRSGADVARVEALFVPTADADGRIDPELQRLLDDQGIELDEGVLLLIRELRSTGRSVARINGHTVVAGVLARVAQRLIDIHGQSEHLSLLRSAEHIEFLDRYAGLLPLRRQTAAAVTALRKVREEREALHAAERNADRRTDLLQFQIGEIDNAGPTLGEPEALEAEIALLANAEQRARLANGTYGALTAGRGGAPSASDLLSEAAAEARELARLDPRLEDTATALEGLSYQLDDLGRSLRAYRDSIEFDPGRLEAASERLEVLKGISRKYGGSIEAALAHREAAAAEVDALTHRQERLEALDADELAARRCVGEVAGDLSRRRQAAASDLAEKVECELRELNMGSARFAVSVAQRPDPAGAPVPASDDAPKAPEVSYAFDATGIDAVEFLLSVNAGEPLRPMAKVASGGETSRVMLALKTILSRVDLIGTLIF